VEFSVVIPARNEAPRIGACLEALAVQDVDASAIEVIVVAAGDDGTGRVAAQAAAGLPFGRFEVVDLPRGNKNAALQLGCPRATAPIVVLLDADTLVEPHALAALAAAVRGAPNHAVHGAALPRYDTCVSRYWELNRRLVKEVCFDGQLSGELIALRRETLTAHGLAMLFPEGAGAKDDMQLGRVLAAHGCTLGYVRDARATTMVPWTLGGLTTTMLRSRRAVMVLLPFSSAAMQAAVSAAIVGGPPAAVLLWAWSPRLAAAVLLPLVVHASRAALRIASLRERGFVRNLWRFLGFDMLGRALKIVAFVERLLGRDPARIFRGQRPHEPARGSTRPAPHVRA
jgi:hypothetical protein